MAPYLENRAYPSDAPFIVGKNHVEKEYHAPPATFGTSLDDEQRCQASVRNPAQNVILCWSKNKQEETLCPIGNSLVRGDRGLQTKGDGHETLTAVGSLEPLRWPHC
jgi:hypothetical protein